MQEVTISNELNIRTDYAYELVGSIDDKILLFRDRGFEFELEAFVQDLQKISSKQLRFDQRKIRIVGIVPQDTCFQINYTYQKDGYQILKSKE